MSKKRQETRCPKQNDEQRDIQNKTTSNAISKTKRQATRCPKKTTSNAMSKNDEQRDVQNKTTSNAMSKTKNKSRVIGLSSGVRREGSLVTLNDRTHGAADQPKNV
ncbi:MAG: hypothetical protein CL521_05070 [Actinobacteria bacterium]|nr:hypothetical protein [Actinomycetota bacterium]